MSAGIGMMIGINAPITHTGGKEEHIRVAVTLALSGIEGEIGLGLMIPIGPIRILPKVGLTAGSFSKVDSSCIADLGGQFDGCVQKSGDSPTHVFFTVGLGILYHYDLAKKPQ